MPLPYRLDLELRGCILRHTLAQIENTPPQTDPFPHISVAGFFPADVYSRLLDALPASEAYEPFDYEKHHNADRQSNRLRYRFDDAWLLRLPAESQALWLTLRSVLGSVELQRAIFGKLAGGLCLRFGCAPEAVGGLEGYALPELFRETQGYRIKPHPDTRKKVVTMQIALPRGEDVAHTGTEFYRRSFRPADWLREPRGFEVVKRMPFAPNCAYAFSVLNTVRLKSWHGRSTLPPGGGVRDSLLNIWYARPEHANRALVEERAFFAGASPARAA